MREYIEYDFGPMKLKTCRSDFHSFDHVRHERQAAKAAEEGGVQLGGHDPGQPGPGVHTGGDQQGECLAFPFLGYLLCPF